MPLQFRQWIFHISLYHQIGQHPSQSLIGLEAGFVGAAADTRAVPVQIAKTSVTWSTLEACNASSILWCRLSISSTWAAESATATHETISPTAAAVPLSQFIRPSLHSGAFGCDRRPIQSMPPESARQPQQVQLVLLAHLAKADKQGSKHDGVDGVIHWSTPLTGHPATRCHRDSSPGVPHSSHRPACQKQKSTVGRPGFFPMLARCPICLYDATQLTLRYLAPPVGMLFGLLPPWT